ncbi:MAG: hypothetical protein KF708_12135 [Pirellulales bacterium]|nr:hypothetical protein [Pirellulales bacterium]
MVSDDEPDADSAGITAASESSIETEYRTWVDATGKHKTEAKFAGLAFRQVTLEKRDGSRVTLPLEKLSAEDQAWIEVPLVASSPVLAGEYDIVRSCELRSGPGPDYERKVNQTATDKLGKIHYLSVDSSVTVTVLQSKGDWAKIQVTQPDFLRESHRGWVPRDVLQGGAATNKRDGWIRYACRVYSAPDKSSKLVGYLTSPSSVGVADDRSGWLRLLHGPVKDEATDEFLELSFDPGLYIEKPNFTTEIPANWNQ